MSWTNSCTKEFYEEYLREQRRRYSFIEREEPFQEYQTRLEEFAV